MTASRPSRSAAVLIGLVLAACADSPSAPSSPGALPVADVGTAPPLYQCETPGFGTVTKVIGPRGGEIAIGPHSLKVPGNALDQDVAITATAAASGHVQIKLEPHGLRFARPVELTLSYAHCATAPPQSARVAYVDDALNVVELLKANYRKGGREISTHLAHFSGYAIAD